MKNCFIYELLTTHNFFSNHKHNIDNQFFNYLKKEFYFLKFENSRKILKWRIEIDYDGV